MTRSSKSSGKGDLLADRERLKLKVLVIDDSRMARSVICQELAEGGYLTVEAANGIEGLAKATVGRPPDLITLDVEMPKLNGFEVCHKLRAPNYAKVFQKFPDSKVPIVFVTGNDNIADRRKGFLLGASDFITKPFEKGALLEVVDNILKPQSRLAGLTVLVVDDNKIARYLASEILRQQGLTVITAEDGASAFEIICKKMAGIDLLVTDFFMPAMNGDELCIKVRRELGLKNLPIIFLTAVDEHQEILKIFKSGADDYLTKPFAREELLARLNIHLQHAKLNKRLRDNIKELQGLSQMKDDLIAVCSHDLRSPLNGILGFSDLLLEKDYLKQEDKESLRCVKDSGEFLLSLINDILDLGKFQSTKIDLEMEPLSLRGVVRTCVNAMRNLAENKQLQLLIDDKSKKDTVMGNRSSLIRTVNNLLSNAIKFSREGKVIRLSIANGQEGKLFLKVEDQGIGIAQDKIPFLFDKFSETSRSGTSGEQGTGLGMSIVKEIVEQHGGAVTVTSVEDEGSVFTISLPLTEKEVVDQDKQNITAKNAGKGCKILVVDDNPVNLKLAQSLLEKRGYTAKTANNGKDAIAMAVGEKLDLIFMDINMPGMDGMTATKKIREQGIKVPIVCLTSSTNLADIEKVAKSGMDDYLTKPFKAAELEEKIARWIK